jgi:hypothetical protein
MKKGKIEENLVTLLYESKMSICACDRLILSKPFLSRKVIPQS